MTEQEEKAIAAFDEEFEGPFLDEYSWGQAFIVDAHDPDTTIPILQNTGDFIHHEAICAILNNRAEQADRIESLEGGLVIATTDCLLANDRITQLEADKAELVGLLREAQILYATFLGNGNPAITEAIKKHEAK